MRVIESVQAMREARARLRGSVGFVPTMGYLHEGHLALVRRASAENRWVVASIFVNPLQFGPKEDYTSYPRDPERDLALLRKGGTNIVFMPPPQDVYPAGFATHVEVGGLTQRLEGASRPTFFRGVTTVVAKLFHIVRPTRAYFGQKDAQQLAVIQKMVADLAMDLEVAPVATVREADGLAMSSRNVYLNPEERQAALVLWRALSLAREDHARGERDASALRQAMTSLIQREPRARIDYVSIAHPGTLEELETLQGPALASLAVWIGRTRLIDNVVLGAS